MTGESVEVTEHDVRITALWLLVVISGVMVVTWRLWVLL